MNNKSQVMVWRRFDREQTSSVSFNVSCLVMSPDPSPVSKLRSNHFELIVLDEDDNAPKLQTRELQTVDVYLNHSGIHKVWR